MQHHQSSVVRSAASRSARFQRSTSAKRFVGKLTATLFVLFALQSTLSAATYYVAKTGNDSNPGSSAQPWLTIQKAANTLVAGDTVVVSAGTYPERVIESTSGTSGAPITYKADTSDGAVVVGGFYCQGSYLNFSGFSLNGTGVPALQATMYLNANASHCSFTNISSTGKPGTLTSGAGAINMTIPGPKNCVFDNIEIVDPNYTWITLSGSGHIVSNCKMSGNAGWDVFRPLGSNLVIRGNVIRAGNALGNPSHPDFFQSFPLAVADPTMYPIQNNLIENNLCIGDGSVDDMQIANMEDTGELGIVRDFTFRNNVFVSIDRTFNLFPNGFKFYNNTFYRCAKSSGFVILYNGSIGRGRANDVDIRNNIFFECGYTERANTGWYAGNAGERLIADYNLVVGKGAGTTKTGYQTAGRELHGVNGYAPLFVNPEANDFRLRAGSPAIGTGSPLVGSFTTDRAGATRGGTWDIGAYQFSSSVDLPLAGPTNVRVTSTGTY